VYSVHILPKGPNAQLSYIRVFIPRHFPHKNILIWKSCLAVNCTLTDLGNPIRSFKSIRLKTYRNSQLICRPCLHYFLWATSEINFSRLILSAEATSVSAAGTGRNARLFTSAPLPQRSTSEGIHNDVFINLLSPFIGFSSRHHCGVYELIKGKFWHINPSRDEGIRNRTLKETNIACLLGVLCTVSLIVKLYAETVYDCLGVCSKYTTLKMGVLKYYTGINTELSETNCLMPVCETNLPTGYLIPESNVLMYFIFTYESVC